MLKPPPAPQKIGGTKFIQPLFQFERASFCLCSWDSKLIGLDRWPDQRFPIKAMDEVTRILDGFTDPTTGSLHGAIFVVIDSTGKNNSRFLVTLDLVFLPRGHRNSTSSYHTCILDTHRQAKRYMNGQVGEQPSRMEIQQPLNWTHCAGLHQWQNW
jgi:hypothetical protein